MHVNLFGINQNLSTCIAKIQVIHSKIASKDGNSELVLF